MAASAVVVEVRLEDGVVSVIEEVEAEAGALQEEVSALVADHGVLLVEVSGVGRKFRNHHEGVGSLLCPKGNKAS